MQTLAQIEKDFESSGIRLTVSKQNTSFEELVHTLSPEIKQLMDKNYQGFLNLLYRIDIPEVKLKKEIALKKEMRMEEVVAELIIKRELQKVVIREFYKNKHDEN
jgi:hypothetical protein